LTGSTAGAGAVGLKSGSEPCLPCSRNLRIRSAGSSGRTRRLQALLEKRNQSILAHGMVPVEENDCRKLAELVTALARAVTTRFDDSLTLLRFPWST
jgi:hypothetical protein